MSSCVKIGNFKFGEDTFRLRYVVEREIVKFVAKDVASNLKHQNTKKAVKDHVDEKYKSTYEMGKEVVTSNLEPVNKGDSLYLQPHTILITKEGVIQLIMKSKLPYAVELQAWLLEEVIPQVLCTGKYAPAVEMDTDIQESKILNTYKQDIAEKDEKIQNLTTVLIETNQQVVKFANALIVANENLITANNNLNVANQNLHEANQTIGHMANRMADIAQDVIAKPSDPQLLHSLAVCSLGGDQYAFLRPQKRSLQRSLNRLSVDERDIVFKSDYVPNAVNVLNKVKETLPRDKFKAKHNKITLLDNLTREQLVEAVQASMTERQIARQFSNMQKNLNSDK
ncbi:BRO-B [Clanis bilineata nucleopolyhedrovirus]|uniref:BRO-B n=1 Tax=Clanis bilineata nucleopolyhedrovirus TaxID=1307957 RepID=Q0N3Z7_9ABAC|nr:BRO-B [Clanis bilineata nucleopolyhedrovirus]ABF47446.1 BRO-B [Clanis bilineata nucleopolyhedrovirus]